MSTTTTRPTNLVELRESGWVSKPVKQEIYDNFMRMLSQGEELFPGIIGYEDTVIPEINIGLIAKHDLLFLGEKGQAKSRLMRHIARFLDEELPYLDVPGVPVHEILYCPITRAGKELLAESPERKSASAGGAARTAMRSGWPRGRSSPTSSARSTRRSWPAA